MSLWLVTNAPAAAVFISCIRFIVRLQEHGRDTLENWHLPAMHSASDGAAMFQGHMYYIKQKLEYTAAEQPLLAQSRRCKFSATIQIIPPPSHRLRWTEGQSGPVLLSHRPLGSLLPPPLSATTAFVRHIGFC